MTGKPHRLQAWERQAIIDAYAAEEKVEAIAAEFGVSVSYVSQLAQRRGLPARRPGHRKFVTTSFTCSSVSAVRPSPVIG